ncbi:MAG TPA: hypothetical protein VNZ53_22790 [Steroidobacteraceae bacterium]|jgi:hypothetical protein|nr:hypothetical protein [Steroidobacteraceae bacterium]
MGALVVIPARSWRAWVSTLGRSAQTEIVSQEKKVIEMTERVQICMRVEGPIIFLNAPATGVTATYPLWNGACASEFLPPGGEQRNYYDLTLQKPVTHAREVRPVEEELTNALLLIAAVWPFSGGSDMVIESREVISSSAFKSNADEVEQQLLAADGLTKHNFLIGRTHINTSTTYSHPPLAHAIDIAKTMLSDSEFVTRQLLNYYYRSRIAYYYTHSLVGGKYLPDASWFINLYKVRDLLFKLYGNATKTKSRLNISDDDWSAFGKLLNNNNFRHAEITGIVPSVSRTDVDRVYGLARQWVVTYLKMKSLTIY